jgi:hypothetical protein
MYILATKVRSQLGEFPEPHSGVGDSTDRTLQANLRKLNFTNTLYQLAYSLLLLQHLTRFTTPLKPNVFGLPRRIQLNLISSTG